MKTQLRQFRISLSPKVTQEQMARRANITLQWYRQIENHPDQSTSYTTAKAILNAINAEHQMRGLTILNLDDLNLKIV